jgi:hypothetical protein
MSNTYKIFVGNLKGKRLLGRIRRKREDHFRMYLKEIGWEVVDGIYLTQDKDQRRAVVNTVVTLRVP